MCSLLASLIVKKKRMQEKFNKEGGELKWLCKQTDGKVVYESPRFKHTDTGPRLIENWSQTRSRRKRMRWALIPFMEEAARRK